MIKTLTPDFDAFMEQWKEGIEAMHNRFSAKQLKTCWACEQAAASDCCCGNPVCDRHSYDTHGDRALPGCGICSDCVDQLQYHAGSPSSDSEIARERGGLGLIKGGK